MRPTELFQTDDEDEELAYKRFIGKLEDSKKENGSEQVYKIIHVVVFAKDKTKPVYRFFAEKMGNRYTT